MTARDVREWLHVVSSERRVRASEDQRHRVVEAQERAHTVAHHLRDLSARRAHLAVAQQQERRSALQQLRSSLRASLSEGRRQVVTRNRAGYGWREDGPSSFPEPRPVVVTSSPRVDDLTRLGGLTPKDQRLLYLVGITSLQSLIDQQLDVIQGAVGGDRPVRAWRAEAERMLETEE